MSNTSPTSPGFLVDLAKSLSAGVVFFISKCWAWVPLSGIAVFLLALGVSAMYGTQYILAAGLYFVGIALLTARLAADAKSHARRGGALFVIIFVGALVFAGSLWLVKHTYETQGHSGNILSAAVSNVALISWAYISDAWRWPWRWMLTSLAVGFVLASMLHVLRGQDQRKDDIVTSPHDCKDDWLHEKVKTDKATIRDLVWVASIFYKRDFDKSQPRIDFVFNVFNMSLLDVVISMEGGYILFSDDNEQFHFDPKFIAQNPARCRSRDSTNFVIRQAVTGDEIKNHFKDSDNTRISFGNLRVTFRGTEQFPEITATNLDVNHYLFTGEGAWHNPNRPKFFGPKEEHRAEPAASASEPEVTKQALQSPNLKLLRVEPTLVYKDDYGKIQRYVNKPRSATWRMQHPSFDVLVAYYRNEPQKGQRPNVLKKVSAELTYNTDDGPFILPRALWLPHNETVDIGYNDVVGFILAEHHKTGTIYARDQNKLVELAKKELTVSVRFLSAGDGSIIEAGSLKIENIKKGNEFEFHVTEID